MVLQKYVIRIIGNKKGSEWLLNSKDPHVWNFGGVVSPWTLYVKRRLTGQGNMEVGVTRAFLNVTGQTARIRHKQLVLLLFLQTGLCSHVHVESSKCFQCSPFLLHTEARQVLCHNISEPATRPKISYCMFISHSIKMKKRVGVYIPAHNISSLSCSQK